MPVAAGDDDDDPASDIPRRLMRVKVLYTFDDSHKTCCLARLPNALNIPTVPIDEDTQVGVIELRTCIEAIVAASPELVAKLGHDYTVYAYDYSEYETPLVGQGMLSWILATASPTPDAPANRSKTMVTGKVRENILGLFSGGIKETLEVKLKLVPVPTFLQSEYLETMERYRNVSRVLPEGFDHSQWAALRSNPEFSAFTAQVAAEPAQSSMALQRVNSGGVESLHQLLTQSHTTEERCGSQYHVPSVTHSRQGSRAGSRSGSRAGSPTGSIRSSAALQQITQDHSRPASRASYTSERPVSRHEPPFDPRMAQQQGQESEQEDGPQRKRARVVQADWRGKSQFGPRADTLRITASTAASVRVHKPTPINPAGGPTNSLEPPPRAPTPRPNELPQPRNRMSVSGTSSLRRESSSQSMRRYASPYAPRGPYSESAIASEDEQMADAEDSPGDFPSSPPIFAQNNDSPAPSSPGLPTFPYLDDSGFMSGTGVDQDLDLAITDKPDQVHPTTELNTEPPSAVICSDLWQFETPGPPELLPTNVRHKHPDYRSQRAAASAKRMTPGPGQKPETRGRKRNDAKPPPPPPPPPRNLAPAPHTQAPSATLPQSQSPAPSCAPVPQYSQHPPHPQSQSETYPSPFPQFSSQPRPQPQVTQAVSQAAPQAVPQSTTQTSPQSQQAPSTSPPTNATTTSSSESSASSSQRNVKAPKKTSTAPKAKKTLPRSNTWSAGTPTEALVEEPAVTRTESRAASPAPRSGSGAKRKKAIEERLMQSLAEGTMPDFCACCGAIQTPTWRKAFYKEIEGIPAGVVTSLDEPGAIVGFEVIIPQADDKNPVEKYKVFKKSLTNTDKANGDFTAMQLCNPCGLHFVKYGTMRPADRWEVKSRAAGPKKGGARSSRKKKKDDKQAPLTFDAVPEPASHAFSDYPDEVMGYMQQEWTQPSEPRQGESQQDAPKPSDTRDNDSRSEGALKTELQSGEAQQEEPPAKRQRTLFSQRRRAASLEPHREGAGDSQSWKSTAAGAALMRAIHSSPPRLGGSQENPVELEDDISPERPTRRILFPSPHRSGQFKSLEDGQEKDKPGQNPFPPHSEPATDAQDKENVPPAEVDDGFAHLFEDLDGNQLLGNPKTPKSTKSIRSFMELMKTPTSKSKRSALTPRDVLLSEGNLALDAAMDAFILQSTPSKAVKTPKTAMTPFTQSLNDLLGTTKTPRSAARNNPSWNLSSPGNSGLIDFSNYDFSMPSTDFPFPSSPPGHFGATFNFALYEDPLTSTDNFWGETSVFNGSSDPFQGAQADGEQTKGNNAAEKRAVELGRIIDEVTAGASKDGGKNNGAEDADTTTTTTEDDAENAGATPAGSEAVDLIPVGP